MGVVSNLAFCQVIYLFLLERDMVPLCCDWSQSGTTWRIATEMFNVPFIYHVAIVRWGDGLGLRGVCR